MKLIAIILVAVALTACTPTADMIQAQQDKCRQIGYTPGTEAHAQCTERGALQQQAAQDALAGSLVQSAIINAWLN